MALAPGTVVNGYYIEAAIGRGGMAVVYRAQHMGLWRAAALKILHDSFREHPDLRARFFQEARAVARLRHPALLVIYDMGTYDETPYLVTELIEGGPLAPLLGTPQPLDRALRLLRPIAEALDYAHGQGILHGNITPRNILLRADGSPILADFGLARAMDDGQVSTRTSMAVGRPEYMAPEQSIQRAETLTPAVDRYALAVIAYELLTGVVPFTDPTPMAVALAHVREEPPSPRSLNPSISPVTEAALLKGLAKSPGDRYPTATALIAALEAGEQPVAGASIRDMARAPTVEVSADATGRSASLPVDAWSPRPRTRHHRLATGAAALALGLATMVMLLLHGGKLTPSAVSGKLTPSPITSPWEGRDLLATLAPGHITTYAGDGQGYSYGDGGLATQAGLIPSGVAVDAAGNLYIADANNRIRKVAAGTDIITTVAGDGTQGFSGDGGPATQAALNGPVGVAVDAAGNLYFADSLNDRVRKVAASTGIITTVAGNGMEGFFRGDGGPATRAALWDPQGVAVDAAGNLYIADHGNARVRKVAAGSGIITTVAGDGSNDIGGDGWPATQSALNPIDVAVDAAGNLYIVDSLSDGIRKVAARTGIITTVAGNGTQGFSDDGALATEAALNGPAGVAVDAAGNLYIADSLNYRIREVAAGTGITTEAGNGADDFSGDGGLATQAELSNPSDVAVDAAGNLYIADVGADRVRVVRAASAPR